MKISHIIGILIIAGAIGIIVTSAGDASQYVSFDKAAVLAENGDESKVHVVGELPRSATGEITGIEYDPFKNPNFMAFQLVDEDGKTHRVITYDPPPSMQDFKRSEKVVIVGSWKEGQFVASDILLKCPSKYEETELKVAEK